MNRKQNVLLFLLLFPLVVYGCFEDANKLEVQARTFLEQLSYKVKGVSCADRDNDSDGYVSCTATVEGYTEPLAIECKSKWSIGDGCRMQKLSVQRLN